MLFILYHYYLCWNCYNKIVITERIQLLKNSRREFLPEIVLESRGKKYLLYHQMVFSIQLYKITMTKLYFLSFMSSIFISVIFFTVFQESVSELRRYKMRRAETTIKRVLLQVSFHIFNDINSSVTHFSLREPFGLWLLNLHINIYLWILLKR